MATEDKRIDQLDPVSVLDLSSLMAMQQGTAAKKVSLQQLLDYLEGQIDAGNAVLFVSQNLSAAQKLQARTNIGAAGEGDIPTGVVLYTAQTLTAAQKLQARTNIGAAAPGEGGGGSAEGAVLYTEQTLTEEQQRQARKNIRCGSFGVVGEARSSGQYSHAEGFGVSATNTASHAEGYSTSSSGYASHSEGLGTSATGSNSHAEGYRTWAYGLSQHVQGEWNIADIAGGTSLRSKYAHIVGNGTADDARSNAHTLDWAGVPWFAGDRVMLGGTGMDDEAAVALVPIFVPQELTEEQKLQARTNIGAAAPGEGGGSAEGAVLYTAQALTEEQKIQARTNIGAMAKGDTEVKVSSKAYLNSYKIVVTVNGVESEGPAMSLVRYDVNQTGLTEEQKAQARANIGVDAYIEQVFLGGAW